MGCGGSTDAGNNSPSSKGKNGQVTSYDRKPKISVRVEPSAQKSNTKRQVVFIFGGPGSRKGRIVEELVASYGFHHITMEHILYTDLVLKVSNVMDINTAADMKDLLVTDPSHLSLAWILEKIAMKIEMSRNPSGIYLIDFIPNLKYILRTDNLRLNCRQAMEKFEKQYPVSFALNLAVPADKVLKAKNVYCANSNDGGMKETGGQGDEADSGRIKRRVSLYEQNVRSFLQYFSDSERLVTVDVTCGVGEFIWQRVHELLCQLHYTPLRTVNTVIFFSFDSEDRGHIDTTKYMMELVRLEDIVDNPQDSMKNLLSSLSRFIDKQSENTESFIVDVSNTTLCESLPQRTDKKVLIFTDIEEGYLETYLPGSPKNFVPSPDSRKYRAVSSVDNEFCLFPPSTPDNICKCIGHLMAANRKL